MKTLYLFAFAGALLAQVPIGTNTGGGGGGSSTANAVRSGLLAAIPATCAVADLYYATDASLVGGGTKLYTCTATNTWTQGKTSNVDGTLTFSSSASGDIVGSVTAGVFDTLAGNATFGAAADKDYASAYVRPPTVAFASLPAAATVSGRVFVVTDCLTASCTAGGGSVRVWLRSNGTTYDVVSPGSGVTAQTTSGSGGFFAHGTPTSASFSSQTFGSGTIWGQEFTAAASISVAEACTYVAGAGTSSYLSMALYGGGTSSNALLGGSNNVLGSSVSPGAFCWTFSPAVSLSIGQPYIIAIAGSGTATLTILEGTTLAANVANQSSVKRFFTAGTVTSPGVSQSFPSTLGSRTVSNTLGPIQVRINP